MLIDVATFFLRVS